MKMRFLACFIAAGILFAAQAQAYAKTLEREAKVIYAKGNAMVEKAGKTGWVPAKEGSVLSDGDRIKTGKDSAVELAFDKEKKNIVRLEENSAAVLRGKALGQIELPQGRIRSLVKSLKKEASFEIKTPSIIAGARGSGWDVETSGKSDNVKAFEDEIFVQSYDQQGKLIKEIFVREGWEVNIDRFQSPGELFELTGKDKNGWNAWRDEVNERIQPPAETGGRKPSDFNGVEDIGQAVERQDEFKQDLLETEDVRKIEDRIQGENAISASEEHGSSGGHVPGGHSISVGP